MKTVDERIENLSDELLDNFIKGLGRINCGCLHCNNCPIKTDGGCMCVKFYDEKARRLKLTNEETAPTSTTELEAKAQELVKQLDLLVELLSKF